MKTQVYNLIDNMMRLSLMYRPVYNNSIPHELFLREMCTLEFKLMRRCGHTVNAINVMNNHFKNPCFIFRNNHIIKNLTHDNNIFNKDNIIKNSCTIKNFDYYSSGRLFDAIMVDCSYDNLSKNDVGCIYKNATIMMRDEKFTILFVG